VRRAAEEPARYIALFGFNDDAAKMGRVSPDQEAGLAAAAGATVERTPLPWGAIEPERGSFDWSLYDRLYAAYRARGIRPIWSVQWSPAWARDGQGCPSSAPGCVPVHTRAHDPEWQAFVAAVVRRYPQSAAIEVWNEENSGLYWNGAPSPERYAQVLRSAWQGVKSVDPHMPVVLGGLADLDRSHGIAADDFLRRVYRSGGAGAMDAIGYHPYPAQPDPVGLLRKRVSRIRTARDAAGQSSIPLWITETGVSTTSQPGYRAFSPTDQASTLVHIYRALAAMPDVRAVVVHRLIDIAPGNGIETGFGMLRRDLTTKPAYCALSQERGRRACG
jgi:GH35 family endo-1,4-beta-xylanase